MHRACGARTQLVRGNHADTHAIPEEPQIPFLSSRIAACALPVCGPLPFMRAQVDTLSELWASTAHECTTRCSARTSSKSRHVAADFCDGLAYHQQGRTDSIGTVRFRGFAH